MANDTNNHFFRFIIPPAPLDSPVPRPGPYLFQSASVRTILIPYCNPPPVVPLLNHLCLIRLPLQAARHKPHSVNKTPSPSQKYGENNHKDNSFQALRPAIFLIMAGFCNLNPLN